MDNNTERTAENVLKDIRDHPEKHQHAFNTLHTCCTINGAVDVRLMEAHEGLQSGMGRRCDVSSGPCSCGGWH